MKKMLFHRLLAILFVLPALFCQSQSTGRVVVPRGKPAPAPDRMETGLNLTHSNPKVPAIPVKRPTRSRSTLELPIGSTDYDLQTNASICNRFTRLSDGKMYATWTIGFEDTAYPDRGTGYNSSENDDWGDEPTGRLEASLRTGWPNYVRTSDGTEFIVNHVFTAPNYFLHYLRREAGQTNWTEGNLPTNTPAGTLWPRAVGGGADGNSIHVIAVTTNEPNGGVIYEGVHMHILYYRSKDAGKTWDIIDGIIPGLDSSQMVELFRADSYAITAKGNTVVVGVFAPFNDVMIFKSEDNGDTWTKHTVRDFPIDQYDVDGGLTEIVESNDGAGTVVIDNNNKVHAFYGMMNYQDTVADGSWFFYPCVSGIAYWNEGHGNDSIRIIADVIDLDGNGSFDVDCENFNFGRYGISGLTSFPSATTDNQNNLFLGYMAVTEGDDYFNMVDNQFYHHIYFTGSADGGETWSAPYDIVNEDIIFDPGFVTSTEASFPHVAPYVDDKVHFIYQQDFRPGLNAIGDLDPAEINYINYVTLDVELFGVTSITEPAGARPVNAWLTPNPAQGSVQLYYNLPENAPVDVSVTDVAGRCLMAPDGATGFEGLNVVNIEAGDLLPGVYFVTIKAVGRSVTVKLVVR